MRARRNDESVDQNTIRHGDSLVEYRARTPDLDDARTALPDSQRAFQSIQGYGDIHERISAHAVRD
ncbi:hypothetical protein GCM10022278_03030 [Allohahella marinimesophila]|uniref:Uncharacterized protein n=1 Tax=Allohahella marinimesophila TaxID=1054972 RepID=A0ABP7NHR8_9GAMM